jgi:hypothetical protein
MLTTRERPGETPQLPIWHLADKPTVPEFVAYCNSKQTAAEKLNKFAAIREADVNHFNK